jgi:flagellar hook-associated protein 1 FlgK
MNEFAAIGVALSGMNAAQEELDVTGNNISNASTPGYVRERVDLAALAPPTPTLLMRSNGAGQGVNILGVSRLDDSYLDAQDLTAAGNAAQAAQTQSVLSQAQAAFNEPGTSGISSQLASFWSQWDAVANNPNDPAARSTLVATAQGLATTFNQTSAQLSQVRADASSGATSDVAEVNRDAVQIASLNSEIVAASAGGGNAAGLADQRDTIVNTLAQLVGATTRAGANGSIDVLVGSEMLVNGVTSSAMTLTQTPATGQLSLTWGDGSAVAAGGQVGALTRAVDTTLPGYQAQLDAAALSLEHTVNTQQAAGVTWTGLGTPTQASAPGQALFTGTGAANLALASGVTGASLAAGSPTAGPADGTNAQAMAELGSSTTGPDALYRALVGQVGTDVASATTQSSAAAAVQSQADAQRQSAEGVNLDEELANMTQFQNAYSASAHFLNTVNTTIQDLLAAVG